MKFGEENSLIGIMSPEMGHLNRSEPYYLEKSKYTSPWKIDNFGIDWWPIGYWRTPLRPKFYYKSYEEAENACREAWLSLAMP